MKPRVAIIDDHTLFTIALGKMLESDCEIVGTFSDAPSFLGEVRQLNPDVVILDVVMPSMSGLQAAREIRRIAPAARILLMTADEDPAVAAAGFGVGAHAYLLKRSAGSELPIAIRDIMNNRRYITPLLAHDPTIFTAHDAADRAPANDLTPRQREVLRLVASGRSMKEAAAILNVSVRTVAFHKYRIMKHLRITSTAALVQFAVREGLV